jgi:hypothetical protein
MMIKKNKVLFAFACLMFTLTGCTQRFADVNSTLKSAFVGQEDVILTKAEILEIPYATTYARINDGAQILMVLAFAEVNPETGIEQLKWLSSDHVMIVTENGRIVKTLALPFSNLAGIAPSIRQHALTQTSAWNGYYDWHEHNRYGYQASGSAAIVVDNENYRSALSETQVSVIHETITFPQLDTSIVNQYWIDGNANVLKTIQYLGPQMNKIELTVAKPYTKGGL